MPENKSIISGIRDYILTCPFLKDGRVNVDYLGAKATEYSIDPLPCNPVIKQYTDGGSQRQYQFAFTSKEYYDPSGMQNIDNSGFYEKFGDWIEGNNKSGILPEIDGRDPIKVELLTCGYLFDTDPETARYQIQCRLIYEQEA